MLNRRYLPATVILLSFFSISLRAVTVNRLNGGASLVYADFSIPGPVVPLELVRTYNSITGVNEQSGWNGAFGWGWTVPFETSLTITPEHHVLLRDGVTGNTVLFKPEKEDPKIREEFMQRMKRAYFERKTNKKLTDPQLAKMQLPDRIVSRLKGDPQFRMELASKFGVKGNIPPGEVLISSEFGYQTLQFKNNSWLRDKDGITQYFDSNGRLSRQRDKNGFYQDYKYSNSQKLQIAEISTQDNASTLRFSWKQDRVIEVVDNRNRRAKYNYDSSGDLIEVTDSARQVYLYKYENKKFPHLLTKVEYVSESKPGAMVYRELKYDDNGLVVSHRERDGVETAYTYGKQPNDPENNFWTRSVAKGPTTSEDQYDEFFIKARSDGSKYLYKQETKLNGVTTVTLFTPCCGKPTQITKNGEVTNFKYYENGLLAEKTGPKEDIRLEYDPQWKKVTKVNQAGFISEYEYDNHGNLIKGSNSHNEKVSLKYDKLGRITEMNDPAGQQISFKYGDQGKPILIADKKVGTIRVEYDAEGHIKKTETAVAKEKGRKPTQLKSQEVVRRVMQGFQHLLDIIRPAGVNLLAG